MGGKFKFRFKKVKIHTWQLILVLLPLLFLAATFLRLDHIKMSELREAALAADLSGNEEDLEKNLSELANFTRKNIIISIIEKNGTQEIVFGTGPFYLEKTYTRAAEKAIEEAKLKLSDGSNPNGNIFAAAMETCRSQSSSWSVYSSCIMTELNKYPAAEDLESQITANIPSTELYRKEFSSPLWVPSLSGFAILLCIILIVVIFIRFLIWLVIRLSLLFI